MKKNIVSLLLAVVITASMLAGCGKQDLGSTLVAKETTSECAAEEMYVEVDNSRDYATADIAPEYEESVEWYSNEVSPIENGAIKDSALEDDEAWYETKETKYSEVGMKDTLTNPLSTFAADVDTASYSSLRKMIDYGYSLRMIPKDEIRTEELVNYFTYNYEEPSKGEVFGVNAQVSACPWNQEHQLMTIGINTSKMDNEDIPDCNIVFLIDVSGSMSSDNKLPLIQKTMAMLVDSFDENDRISIVTYASGVETVLDGCKGDEDRKIIKAFEGLETGGSTNGGDGIKMAYKIAQKNYIEDGVNRVIICSDGDFNVGLTTQKELEDMISKKKDSGIFLSTLGFGMGNYSDATMETLADKGNGNYAYIDDLTEAKRVLVDEMTSTFVTVAKDVKLQVEFNPAVVSEYRLIGYDNRVMADRDFKDDTKDGGELGAGHQVTAIYEIVLASDNDIDLKYQDKKLSNKGAKGDEYCTMTIAYKEPEGLKSRYIEYPIGTECYSINPNSDFRLAAAVAQASLAIKDSNLLVDVSPEDALMSSASIIRTLRRAYTDEYVAEFGDMLEELMEN